ncbi:hypothetical protein [uncultured Algibacter sp.]|uniref:hypothetical protein n=1 Tax=uncultured Algibacter sp. TaxID=298659 RepID=UPI0026259541|nr:hypothetical protein [uncultured Algibacter sp.]
MKQIITIIFFLFSIVINAQYNDWKPAKVFLQTGEVLIGRARLSMSMNRTEYPDEKGLTSFSIRVGNKEYLRFLEGNERRSTKFDTEEIKKVIFDLDYKKKGKRIKRKAIFIPIYKSLNKTKTGFAELIIDGKIKLAKKKISGAGVARNYTEEILLIRENESAIPINYAYKRKSFKKRTIEYFYDCPSLISKIESEELKKDDLELIVNYYNDNCAK